jgi:hypothetical protein
MIGKYTEISFFWYYVYYGHFLIQAMKLELLPKLYVDRMK